MNFRRYNTDIILLHKKKAKSNKNNYRNVNILPKLSKVHEKLIYNQLYDYFDKILFSGQCGFYKGYKYQHCLLAMLQNFNTSADNGNEFMGLSTNLTEVFVLIIKF